MSNPDKTIFEKLARWVDPQRDFDNIDFENDPRDKLALRGAVSAIKILVRGGIGGALLGTAISYVTDGKIDEGAYLGAKIGIGIDAVIWIIRLAIHKNKPED